MRAATLPVAMRLHDLVYLDKRLQAMVAWLQLPAITDLRTDIEAGRKRTPVRGSARYVTYYN